MKLSPVYSISRQILGTEIAFSAQDDVLRLLGGDGEKPADSITQHFKDMGERQVWFGGMEGKLLYEFEVYLAAVSALLRAHSLKPRQIGFIVGEQAGKNDNILKIARHLRAEGFRVIHDWGSPHQIDVKTLLGSGRWLDAVRMSIKGYPDFDSDFSSALRHVVRAYSALGFDVIAGHVDTLAEYAQAKNYSFQCFQGFFNPNIEFRDSASVPLKTAAREQEFPRGKRLLLGNLKQNIEPVSPADKTGDVLDRLVDSPGSCLPVVSGLEVVGILRSSHAFKVLAECHRLDETCRRPVGWLVEHDVIIKDAYTPLSALDAVLVDYKPDRDPFVVVTHFEHYYGVVPMETLIKVHHAEEVKMAKEANPLTGLPGQSALRAAFDAYSEGNGKDVKRALVIADLNHFKAFNDAFGLNRGDEILKAFSRVLVETMLEYEERGGHLTHFGGDDFVVLLPADAVDAWAEKVIDRWRLSRMAHYREEDRQRGYFVGKNRDQILTKIPLTEITIAAAVGTDWDKTMTAASYLKDSMKKDEKLHFSGGYSKTDA